VHRYPKIATGKLVLKDSIYEKRARRHMGDLRSVSRAREQAEALVDAAIEPAQYYRDVCLEAAGTAKYSFMAREHQRLALTAAIPF